MAHAAAPHLQKLMPQIFIAGNQHFFPFSSTVKMACPNTTSNGYLYVHSSRIAIVVEQSVLEQTLWTCLQKPNSE